MDNARAAAISGAMRADSDILIAGGGLTGAALALALARTGFRVTVIDAPPAAARAGPGSDGRAYALAAASRRMLAALGLWPALAPEAQPILRIVASDGRPGEGASALYLAFDHAEIEEGPMGYMVEDRHLRPALIAALAAEPRIVHLAPARIVAQETAAAGVRVTLETGEVLAGQLLVGADGAASGTAARAGIGRIGRDYGQTALVCAVAHERPHAGTAHQFFMPGGPLAILPLRGERSAIVWSERRAIAEAVAALDDAGFLAALRPRFGAFLGAIRLEGARGAYPLALSLAERLVAPRLALVGDAAHGIHPIAGQGLNLGLRDAAALAEVLAAARRRGEDPGAADVLERYARWRRFDTAVLALATDGFNRLFSNDNPLLRAARDLGFAAVARLPGLRRAFIREAAGLAGDVPRLLRGLPL
jgi:2-octaprenyl-6-methoxyphenol hydroxylase